MNRESRPFVQVTPFHITKSLVWWRDRTFVRHTGCMDTSQSDVTLARDAFAEALRVEMARAGVNLRDLSNLTRAGGSAGIAETTIGKYTRAEQTPRWPEQLQLADALGMPVGDLIAHAVEVYERLKDGRQPITR